MEIASKNLVAFATTDVDGTNVSKDNTNATKSRPLLAATIFYLGEVVRTSGRMAGETEKDRKVVRKVTPEKMGVAAASKGLCITAIVNGTDPHANSIGNFGTVIVGLGDTSLGTTSLPTR